MARLMQCLCRKQGAKLLLVLALFTMVAACGTAPETVMLRHPETGHTVDCGPHSLECVSAHQLQGYESVPR